MYTIHYFKDAKFVAKGSKFWNYIDAAKFIKRLGYNKDYKKSLGRAVKIIHANGLEF